MTPSEWLLAEYDRQATAPPEWSASNTSRTVESFACGASWPDPRLVDDLLSPHWDDSATFRERQRDSTARPRKEHQPMKRPVLLGLVGKAGAGKDTVADLLKPYGYERVAFADALRSAAYDADPMIDVGYASPSVRLSHIVDAHGWDVAKRAYPDVRRFLQRLGVAMRDVRPGCWVDIAVDRICDLSDDGKHVVITDVRFADEVAAIRGMGGVVVRIVRDDVADLGGNAGHVSEQTDSLTVDYGLSNHGDLNFLRDQVRSLHNVLMTAKT